MAPAFTGTFEIAAAGVVLIATPEYNHSVPGARENALDRTAA